MPSPPTPTYTHKHTYRSGVTAKFILVINIIVRRNVIYIDFPDIPGGPNDDLPCMNESFTWHIDVRLAVHPTFLQAPFQLRPSFVPVIRIPQSLSASDTGCTGKLLNQFV